MERHLNTIELAEGRMKGSSSSISKGSPRKLAGTMDKNKRCTTGAIVINECGKRLVRDNRRISLFILEDNLECNVQETDFGLDIFSSGITLDCNGNTITGVVPDGISSLTFDGIRIRNDNIVLKNCILTGFDNGIKLGQEFSAVSNILLQNIDSHHNRVDGLDLDAFRGVLEDITVLDSTFNDIGNTGVQVNTGSFARVENLVVSGVQANRNGDSGFELHFIKSGRLVDVEANNNGSDVDQLFRDGINVRTRENDDTKLVIQDSRACGNGDEDISDSFNAATFHGISCTNDDGKGICACDCP